MEHKYTNQEKKWIKQQLKAFEKRKKEVEQEKICEHKKDVKTIKKASKKKSKLSIFETITDFLFVYPLVEIVLAFVILSILIAMCKQIMLYVDKTNQSEFVSASEEQISEKIVTATVVSMKIINKSQNTKDAEKETENGFRVGTESNFFSDRKQFEDKPNDIFSGEITAPSFDEQFLVTVQDCNGMQVTFSVNKDLYYSFSQGDVIRLIQLSKDKIKYGEEYIKIYSVNE